MRSSSSPLELMELHVRALFVHDDRSRLVSTNEWRPLPAPRLFLGRTREGNLWRVREDLPGELTAELAAICRDEPVTEDLTSAPKLRDELLERLGGEGSVERVWSGPAYWASRDDPPFAGAVHIGLHNADLLRGDLEAWREDVPHLRPFVAISSGAEAVAVCASVRITGAAHEAGVETLPSERRKGHASNAVAAWARAVRARGALPLYSTSWQNRASQGVASRLALVLFGTDFHVG